MNAVASEVWRRVNAVDSQCRIVLTSTVLHVVKGRRGNPSLTMLTIALLSLDSVATGAIPDGCYALTPCTVTCAVGTPCTVTYCGITVADGGSSWTSTVHFTFNGGRQYCDVVSSGRYSYSGSEVIRRSIGSTSSGDSSCFSYPAPESTFVYKVENDGVVSFNQGQISFRYLHGPCPSPPPPRPSPPPPSASPPIDVSVFVSIAIGVSVFVSVLGVAILGFACWRRKRARMTERGGQLISAPTYDMGLNEVFISAAQPSSQSPVVAFTMRATTPIDASQAPIVAVAIPATTPIAASQAPVVAVAIPATTAPVFGVDGKPVSHKYHLDLELD